MDFSAFAGDEFDPKDWINNAWKTSDTEDKETFVSNAVAKLQLYTKQLSIGLDDTTAQIVRGVPRVLQEASALSAHGEALRQKLATLETRARQVESDTGHSIDSLRRIDKLKCALQNACLSLREADKWSQMAGEISAVLDEGVPTELDKLRQLSELVAATTASLEVLTGSSDYERQLVQLEVLYNRLEAALSPAIVEAFTVMDSERGAIYSQLLSGMGRSAAAVRYWRRVQAARLEAEYRPGVGGMLPAHAHEQMEWLCNVIRAASPVSELMSLHTELLRGSEPAACKMAAAAVRRGGGGEDALDQLVELRAGMRAFLASVRAMVDGSREEVPREVTEELGRAVHAPLRALLPEYTEIQAKAFTDLLATVDCRLADHLDAAKSLQLAAERCEGWIRSADNTGRKIAGVACYPFLMAAVEALFAELCSRLSARHRLLQSEPSEPWAQLPAALALACAAGLLLTTTSSVAAMLAARLAAAAEDTDATEAEAYLLTAETRERLRGLRAEPPLRGAEADAGRVCRTICQTTVECLCIIPERHLERVSELDVWSNNDDLSTSLPDFSVGPQEYATLVGQYLMTLPQHLEPLLAGRPAGLAAALACPGDPALYLLNVVCTKTLELYTDKVFAIKSMDTLGAKRCATDIAYLTSVVEELGGTVPASLANLESTLRSKGQQEAK